MHLEGRLQEAFEASERALGRIEELGLADARGSNGFHLVSNLRLQAGANQLCMGWLEEARASLEESLALALHCGDPDSTCFAYQYLAECCVERGDVESALRYGRAGVEAAKRHTSGYSGVWTDVGLARALIAGEQLEEACGLLEERLADSLERRTALHGEGVLSQLLAEGHLGLGQLGRARAGCDRAIAVARRNGTRLWECDAQLLLARILLRADAAPGEVAAAVERAGELIEQTGAEGRRPRLDDLRAAQAREPS
jgi:tetratricopeptide (TPR) repeat protein